MVSPLRRVTLEKPQSNQRALAPFVRCLAPVLLRGGDYRHSRRGGLKADLALQLSALSFFAVFTHSGHMHRSPVGAGLLAMASFQAIGVSTDPPLSPASRLLQGIGFTRFEIVGAGLPAMDVNDNACCLNERVA